MPREMSMSVRWETGPRDRPISCGGRGQYERKRPSAVFVFGSGEVLTKETVLDVLKRLADQYGVGLSDGAIIYAARAKAHQADHRVTLRQILRRPKCFTGSIRSLVARKRLLMGPVTGEAAPGGSSIWQNSLTALIGGI